MKTRIPHIGFSRILKLVLVTLFFTFFLHTQKIFADITIANCYNFGDVKATISGDCGSASINFAAWSALIIIPSGGRSVTSVNWGPLASVSNGNCNGHTNGIQVNTAVNGTYYFNYDEGTQTITVSSSNICTAPLITVSETTLSGFSYCSGF